MISPLGSRRILTNAHAVANQVAVKVRKHGSAQKFNARVLAVGHEVRGCLCSAVGHKCQEPSQIAGCLVHSSCTCTHTPPAVLASWAGLHPPRFPAIATVNGRGVLSVASSFSRTPPHPHVLTGVFWHCCCLQCDIAMLTVDDDEFWEDVQPLEINGLPAMQESVMVVGFPTG